MGKKTAVLFLALILAGTRSAPAKEFAEAARACKTDLVQKILPYWYDTAIDRQHGGYLLADDAQRRSGPATEKQIVTQARMIWGFSHAHLKGLEDGKRDYLKAAEQGYHFLVEHFLDPQFGGYYWTTDPEGKPLDRRKIVYGESFVVYALVEYYRASGDKTALTRAMDLYHVLQKRAHDRKYGGWIEHFERDWTPILKHGPNDIVEVAGFKSANTHLHLMEALTELYDATRDRDVKKSLAEAIKINCTWFYPLDPARSAFHRQLDWGAVTNRSSAGLSYGHNVEFAWLMVRAQNTLGQKPAWPQFTAHLEHALKYGYDWERGGLYSRGFDNQPATDTDKVWWVQAEMVAALTDAIQHEQSLPRKLGRPEAKATENGSGTPGTASLPNADGRDAFHRVPNSSENESGTPSRSSLPRIGAAGRGTPNEARYSDALEKLLGFISKFQANPGDGIWLDTVTAEGKPKVSAKAHNWKANYHDVRALVKFEEAFAR